MGYYLSVSRSGWHNDFWAYHLTWNDDLHQLHHSGLYETESYASIPIHLMEIFISPR